jgi:hypothetical protein
VAGSYRNAIGEIRVPFETVKPVPNAGPTYNGAPTDTPISGERRRRGCFRRPYRRCNADMQSNIRADRSI